MYVIDKRSPGTTSAASMLIDTVTNMLETMVIHVLDLSLCDHHDTPLSMMYIGQWNVALSSRCITNSTGTIIVVISSQWQILQLSSSTLDKN